MGSLLASHPRLTVLGFAVALAGTAALVVTMTLADPTDDPPADLPGGVLDPGEPTTPEGGTVVPQLGAGESVAIGRIIVLPTGSVPNQRPVMVLPEPGDFQSGVDLTQPDKVAQGLELGIPVGVPEPPPGMEMAWGGADGLTRNGVTILLGEAYSFTGDDYYRIDVTVRRMQPGEAWEIVAYAPEAGHDVSSVTIRETPVAIVHANGDWQVQSATEAYLLLGDYLVQIDAPAFPAHLLVNFLEGYIEENRERLEAASETVAIAHWAHERLAART